MHDLKVLNSLKANIAYLEEAEELLQAIWGSFDVYELERKMKENPCVNHETISKLERHFDFDDSE